MRVRWACSRAGFALEGGRGPCVASPPGGHVGKQEGASVGAVRGRRCPHRPGQGLPRAAVTEGGSRGSKATTCAERGWLAGTRNKRADASVLDCTSYCSVTQGLSVMMRLSHLADSVVIVNREVRRESKRKTGASWSPLVRAASPGPSAPPAGCRCSNCRPKPWEVPNFWGEPAQSGSFLPSSAAYFLSDSGCSDTGRNPGPVSASDGRKGTGKSSLG